MFPQRPAGPAAPPRPSGSVSFDKSQSFDAIKARVVGKLEDRLNPGTSKRMPSSILRQSLRTHAEQIAEQEGSRLAKPDRDRLVDEALAEVLGYGPLDELFKDANVREVLVSEPHVVLVRRDTAGWLPTNVKFRDEAHLRTALDRLATHADPVGGVTASVNLFDLKLPNGFRAVAVIPPEAVGQSPNIAFVRVEAIPPAIAAEPPTTTLSGRQLNSTTTRATTGSSSSGARLALDSASVATTAPTRASGATPVPRPSPLEFTPSGTRGPLNRYRKIIMEQLIAKMARHRIYDVQRVEAGELRKIIAAFIIEYCEKERIYLSDADQSRLLLEILAAMQT